MNLSEILGSSKRDLKKKGYGAPPDSCPTRQWHPRLVGNCLVCIYQFLISNTNFKTTSNLQNFLFSINFTNPLRKTIYLQIYLKITKKFTKRPRDEHRDS